MAYRVFTRNWWRYETSRFTGQKKLVPNAGGRKTTIGNASTEEEARAMCKAYNDKHKPGPLSRKAEYEEIW